MDEKDQFWAVRYGVSFSTSLWIIVPGADLEEVFPLLICSSFSALVMASFMCGYRIRYISSRFLRYSPSPRDLSFSVSFGQYSLR